MHFNLVFLRRYIAQIICCALASEKLNVSQLKWRLHWWRLPWPQISFLKDDYMGRSGVHSPLSGWFWVSLLWTKAKLCQSIVARYSIHTLKPSCMNNPVALKLQWSSVSVYLTWIWATASLFMQQKIAACSLQNSPNLLAFMVFWDPQKTKQISICVCMALDFAC